LIIIATLFLILGFQNCSNTASFDADGALVAKTDVSIQDGSNTYDGVIDEIADEMPVSNPPPSTGGGGVVVPPPTPAPNYHGGDRDYAGRDDVDDDDRDDNDNDYDHDDVANSHSEATHVCILESGSGKSVRLGKTSGDLTQDTGVDDVCMSEKACLGTVSKAFAVKGAEKRGYCKEKSGNPNVVKMTDKEVEDSIAKEMLKRIMSSN
jgi:hypothetical protein